MSVTGNMRGYPVHWDGEAWRYVDTGEPTVETWESRPCGHCGLDNTPEGHDGCLGTLPGVMNACCGHGTEDDAYVQLAEGGRLAGVEALEWIAEHGGGE